MPTMRHTNSNSSADKCCEQWDAYLMQEQSDMLKAGVRGTVPCQNSMLSPLLVICRNGSFQPEPRLRSWQVGSEVQSHARRPAIPLVPFERGADGSGIHVYRCVCICLCMAREHFADWFEGKPKAAVFGPLSGACFNALKGKN